MKARCESQKRGRNPSNIDTQARIWSAAPVSTPFDSANMDNHSHQRASTSTNNQRVAEWIYRQISPQTRITTQIEDNRTHLTATAVASRAWHQAPVHQTIPINEAFENITLMATTRDALSSRRSAIHDTLGEQPVWDTPGAPLIGTIPLPPVAEELEDIPLMSIIANESRPIQGLVSQHPIDPPQWWEYPPAPMMRPIALPPVGDALPIWTPNLSQQARNIGFEWHLNCALRYHESVRAVVQPVLSDMLPYPGHRWGAQDQEGDGAGELNVHFAYSTVPATDPPLTRMRLIRPFGGKLVVTPTIGNQYVSVGDVQKMVVAWMRWEQPHLQDEGIRLTRRETALARDGTTMSVEVWVWRGLARVRGDTDLWEIHF